MAHGPKNRKRLVYWLTPKLTPAILDYSEALTQTGYDVQSFLSLGDMMVALEKTRPGILVLSDLGTQEDIRDLILGTVAIPDLSGTKLVMVSFTQDHALHNFCVGQNFRDVIQGDLAVEPFITRFRYATALRPVEIPHEPVRLAIGRPAKILLPCRITGVNKSHIKVESRLNPQPGKSYLLLGKLAESMGQRALKITITQKLSKELNYRFSSGFVAFWQSLEASPDSGQKLTAFWQHLQAHTLSPQRRIYIAMTQSPLRTKVLQLLKHPRFLVTTALQRHSLKSEPHYFSPQLLIMDLDLALDQGGETLWESLKQAPLPCKFLLMGSPGETLTAITKSPLYAFYLNRLVFSWEVIPDPEFLPHWIDTHILPQEPHADPTTPVTTLYHLSADDSRSFASLVIGGHITSIHPSQVEWTTEDSLGAFTMLRLKSADLSTILKRSPLIKVTSEEALGPATGLQINPQASLSKQVWTYHGLFSDLSAHESKQLARWMIKTLAQPLVYKGWLDPAEAKVPEVSLLATDDLSDPPETYEAYDAREAQSKQESLKDSPLTPPPETDRNLLNSSHSQDLGSMSRTLGRSKELGRDALKGIKESFEGNQAHGWVQVVAPMILVGGLMLLILWGLFVYLGNNYVRSGSVYTDQLKNFSP